MNPDIDRNESKVIPVTHKTPNLSFKKLRAGSGYKLRSSKPLSSMCEVAVGGTIATK